MGVKYRVWVLAETERERGRARETESEGERVGRMVMWVGKIKNK